MRILVTGGAGFIGSAVVRRAISEGHDVLTVDKLTYAGSLKALAAVQKYASHQFIKADVSDGAAMSAAFKSFAPNFVLHLAAESHVDRSIDDPSPFIETNIRGTFVMLETAVRHFNGLSDTAKKQFRFVHVSTDEVFGSVMDGGMFKADSPYAPNSPYAASKAAADHLARAWGRSYGLPVIVTNCSNNYGPYQHAEKLIPTVIRHALAGAPIPIYGNGLNVRDWLYVDDHAAGLLAAALRGASPNTYLFGGRSDVTNLVVTNLLCEILDTKRPLRDGKSYADQIAFVKDRPGHDYRYAVDSSYTERELNWSPAEALKSGLVRTIDWYLANPEWLAPPQDLGRLGLARGIENEKQQ
jgi:dTDP-glucose 4,6-dehydratase